MKPHAGILILSLLSFVSSTCQIKLTNQSLTDTTQSVLFLHFENRMVISGSAKGAYSLVSSKHARIEKTVENVFTIKPFAKGKDTLFVYEGKRLVLQQDFEVRLFQYVLSLGSIQNGDTVSKAAILANKKFLFYSPGCNCPLVCYVNYFNVNFMSSNIDPAKKTLQNWGNSLSDEVILQIRQLRPNDRIIFKEIHLQDISSIDMKAEDFTITIK